MIISFERVFSGSRSHKSQEQIIGSRSEVVTAVQSDFNKNVFTLKNDGSSGKSVAYDFIQCVVFTDFNTIKQIFLILGTHFWLRSFFSMLHNGLYKFLYSMYLL